MKKASLFLLALLPSLWMLWVGGGMPHLGYFHDDGIYAGTAAAIADGRGPVLESLPGEPWQVKYPPLYPLYLALGVKWEWSLLLLTWVLLPVLLWQLWKWRGDWAMVLIVGWNVFSVVFASTTLSELFATVLLIVSIRMLEGGRTRGAAAVAGLAYLARTALIALPAGAVMWLLWKRRWREAGEFALIFAPFFVGWTAFVATHTPAGVEGPFLYYLSYGGFFRENMSWELLPVVLQANLMGLLGSLGGSLFFNSGDSFIEVNFARLLLFGSITGLVRQTKKSGLQPFPVVAVPYVALLTVWNFVPNERFLYPLLPLLLDGLLTELRHFREMLRVTWVKQRGATVVIGGMVAAGVLWMVWRNGYSAWTGSPSIPQIYQALGEDREKAYAWIRGNTPEGANFLAYEDPILRRKTGRHGVGIHAPTRLFYTNDMKGIVAYHDSLIRGMRGWNLQYVLIGPNDLAQDILADDRAKILRDWRTRGDLETVYENGRYAVRRLRE